MDKYPDNVSPTIQEVRKWAFDKNAYFIEQDEDLVLHSTKYIPVLIELASDNSCPKNDYCLSILTDYSRLKLAFRDLDEIQEISRLIKEYDRFSDEKVNEWKSTFLSVSSLINNPQEISEARADEIAFILTVGKYCLRSFKKMRTLKSGFIEYMAWSDSYKEYVYINPKTSVWKSSRHFQLNKI